VTRRRRTRGFTLVEVLVAVAIVALVLAAGARAGGTVLDNAQRLQDVTLAQWCVDNQLTEMRLVHDFPNEGVQSFGCDQLGQSMQGSMKVQATPNPSFRRVDVSVSDNTGHSVLTVSTVISRY
jgi:general secretion pathway protein I